MPVVITLTLTTRPGHYDQALETYLAFVDALEEAVDDLKLALIAGEPGQDTIHAVGIYESAEVAEELASLPFFAAMVDSLEPHLAETPDRVEMDLVGLFATDLDVKMPEIGKASLVEVGYRAKLGHADEVLAIHETYAAEFQTLEAELWMGTARAASARALLTEAGYKDGIDINWLVLNNSEYKLLTQAIQAMVPPSRTVNTVLSGDENRWAVSQPRAPTVLAGAGRTGASVVRKKATFLTEPPIPNAPPASCGRGGDRRSPAGSPQGRRRARSGAGPTAA